MFSYRNPSRYSLLLLAIVCGEVEFGNSFHYSILDFPLAISAIFENTARADSLSPILFM
ncbi:MAG: hypothetical protein RMX59_014945 [Nostoc sp. DedSLP05]